MVFAPHPFLTFCTGGDMAADEDMPGVMPRGGKLLPDPSPFWRPPGSRAAAGDRSQQQQQHAALGTVSGVALGGDGSLWAFYRCVGYRGAWNCDPR